MRTATVSAQERSARVPAILDEVLTGVRMFRTKCHSAGSGLFSLLSTAIRSMKEFSAKYPAVLSGYIIYGYLFITIMRFFLKVKSRELTMYDIYDTFDALPFMWLLSSALVKIIDIRTKLHDSEKERIQSLRELDRERTQLETMHEVANGFQHKINNPLAIISLALGSAKRAAAANPLILERMIVIEESACRIKQAVIDFSGAQKYEVEHVGHVVGSMASPASFGGDLSHRICQSS